ncbi:4Fe-4S dicluster domain-containing protein [Desulfothermus sp.]
MGYKYLAKQDIKELFDKVSKIGDVFAPVKKGVEVVWSEVQDVSDILFDFKNTSLSPKGLFFPQTECMFEFKNNPRAEDGLILQEVPPLEKNRVIFNIRPCDARAFSILDKVFMRDEDSLDVYWKDKRDKTTLIGLACNNPASTCFCTQVGSSPFGEQGLDVLMIDLGDKYLLKPITDKGKDILDGFNDASDEDVKKIDELKENAENKIKTKLSMDNILSREILEVYENPYWDRLHETCLNCGACTFYCPTCHCFDIQDETKGEYGRRVRNWDTCMSWLFTQHASGHNPRGTKKHRVRQRFMHKFKYMPFKLDGDIGCVGCGRCILVCPVNIDVRDVVNNLNK